MNWKPVRDFCFIRELPVEQTGLIVSPIDLNRSTEHSPILYGIVEAIGPRVTDVMVGDRVAYEIGAGEYRLPEDDMVRIMYEHDVAWVDTGGCSYAHDDPCDGCNTAPVDCPGWAVGVSAAEQPCRDHDGWVHHGR